MQDRTLLIVTGPGPDGAAALENECAAICQQHDLMVDFRHTDDTAEMARWITEDGGDHAGLVVSPVGATGSSLDDLGSAVSNVAASKKPVVEVHWNNILRDGMAQPLQIPGVEMALVCGLGVNGYRLAINGIAARLEG